eukprot:CAMPEP_0116853250 /NCGR_PEP_ID=MMETSP0418-20121206/17802_1 /TAXON_ID=1158023 /ORGANISM="Astrosyne radiata, Strain 13vi08-1A" /LENGTH=235 /DNA_ID=CAMNT_0004485619 /DNA_START=29 /DNA_END=739 /DNA_ORIENTATION=-
MVAVPIQSLVMSSEAFVSACGKLAPIASVVVFMAPIPTIQQVSREGSVGNLPLLPYSSMVASTFVWVLYGILVSETKVWAANAVGLILGLYYCFEFAQVCPRKAPTLPGSVMQHAQGVLAIWAISVLLGVVVLQSAALVGNLGVTLCVIMFASPLAALKVVLQTKSASSIPLPFTLASVWNCFCWSVVGIWDMKDSNIYVPNLLGLAFGLTQLALKLVFGDKSTSGTGSTTQLPI